MAEIHLDDGIEQVRGIGPSRAADLRAAGVHTVEDLLLNLPMRYEDRSRRLPIAELVAGEAATVAVTVRSRRRVFGRGRPRVEARVTDGSGSLHVVWFNQTYMADVLEPGARVLLYGKPARYRDRLQLVNPVHEEVGGEASGEGDDAPEDDDRDGASVTGPPDGSAGPGTREPGSGLHVGRPVPVYRRIGGLGPALLRRLVHAALEELGPVPEGLPGWVLDELELMPRRRALRQVHWPPRGGEALEAHQEARSESHRRLVMQEFLDFQTALRLQRRGVAAEPGFERRLDDDTRDRLTGPLPFRLTAAQERCLQEILADLESPRAMHRLLQGDVGSGKTAVAACAMLAVAASGEQAVLLAPTEILARQHAATLGPWARELGFRCDALTAALPRSEARRRLAALRDGSLHLAVGTHALIQPRVGFERLGLVVVDEQHRFGVEQRATLRTRGRRQGRHPDLLVMTATPIPRSLALTLYGDLDVSRIDELPPGREPVATEVLGPDRRHRALTALQAAVDAGERAFVVAPRIEEGEEEILSVDEVAGRLRSHLGDDAVVTLHGGMDADDKAASMEAFAAGEAPVLVATTVVEVGVDVPSATLMLVEHAERFGLAQLHQLRGRVGRGERPGRCLLLAHPPLTETARARLQALVRTTDGFRLAEEDLRLRGPGEVLGTRQTGAFGLRVGDPFAHPEWLERAHAVARRLAGSDDAEAAAYRDALRDAWARRLRLARSG